MENRIYKINELLDMTKTRAGNELRTLDYPWEALPFIKEWIIKIGNALPEDEFYSPRENVWIARDAEVFESAYIAAPCIIDHGTQVRHCAFIRGSALVGRNCVVGNSTELKNVILFDNVQVPHYNYVGDSILGYKAHMGAGSITSNVKSDRSLVAVHAGKGNTEDSDKNEIQTGLKKFGAVLGDFVEVGCNSVLNPGSVIGRHTNIYPLSAVRGVIPENSIYKAQNNIVKKC